MAKPRVNQNVQRLIDQRDKLLREIEAIKNKVWGLEMAISLLESPADREPSRSGASVKGVLLDLLNECGTTGLNAISAVEMANRRGVTLKQASVSATLSRFKADGIVDYDGDRYRLKEYRPDTVREAVHFLKKTAAL